MNINTLEELDSAIELIIEHCLKEEISMEKYLSNKLEDRFTFEINPRSHYISFNSVFKENVSGFAQFRIENNQIIRGNASRMGCSMSFEGFKNKVLKHGSNKDIDNLLSLEIDLLYRIKNSLKEGSLNE